MGKGKDKKKRSRRKATAAEIEAKREKKRGKKEEQALQEKKQEQEHRQKAKVNFLNFFPSASCSDSNTSESDENGGDCNNEDPNDGDNGSDDPPNEGENGNNNPDDGEGNDIDDPTNSREKEGEAQNLCYPSWYGTRNPEEANQEIEADLDWASDDDGEAGEEENNLGETINDNSLQSVMKELCATVQDRLREEVKKVRSTMNSEEKWLLKYLHNNDFWIRREHYKYVSKKLGLAPSSTCCAYYQNVRVWLPEVQYGQLYKPPCVSCGSNTRVAIHTWFRRCPSRHVVGLSRGYHVMTCQYICYSCDKINTEAKTEAASTGTEEYEKTVHLFMGYHSKVLTRLADGIGDEFPALLTYRSGLDKQVLRLLRPLNDASVRPEAISNLLLELHSLEYTDWFLRYERRVRKLKRLFPHNTYDMFSDFSDKTKYSGMIVPTGRYLTNVRKKYGESIQPHLDREVKKRGARRLHIDGNAKIPKLLCRHDGKPLYKTLMTGTNEYREIRLSAFSVTESHDQLEPAIMAMQNTMSEYGQAPPELVTTDNAPRDNGWLVSNVPSLKKTQDRLDVFAEILNNARTSNEAHETVTRESNKARETIDNCALSENPSEGTGASTQQLDATEEIIYHVHSTAGAINASSQAIRDFVKLQPSHRENVLSLDTECDTEKNQYGQVTKALKTALIQIGYANETGEIVCDMYQVARLKTLPDRLTALFQDKTFTFVGSRVSEDLKKIGKDFNLVETMSAVKYHNLGKYARERDVVQNGSISLGALHERVLKTPMDKSDEVRTSKWSSTILTARQKRYAALDAIKSLEIFIILSRRPNLNERLASDEVEVELDVDIVPSHGCVADMATRAAVGSITNRKDYTSPDGIAPKRVKIDPLKSRVVHVTEVMSRQLIIPGLSCNGRRVCLGDFGDPPFLLPIPFGMLKKHCDLPDIRTYFPTNQPTGRSLSSLTPPAPRYHNNTPQSSSETPPAPSRNNTCSSFSNPADDDEIENQDDDKDAFFDTVEFECDEDGEALTDGGTPVIGETGERSLLTPQALNMVETARVLGERQGITNSTEFLCANLKDPPDVIKDKFRAVLGDNFHQQKRPRVPVRHTYKKAYFVSLMNAFLAWNEERLHEVYDKLKTKGWSDKDIEMKMYYKPYFFQQRVDRIKLPPSKMYWRVRAVYVTFGNLKDHKGKPLFNREAWTKANGVLNEILQGFASDPPGFPMYTIKLNKRGEPVQDKYDITVIESMAGTNDTELWHKHLRSTFGTWQVGIQMSCYVLAERRHRYNQRMSERHRTGFPKIGHYDTWKIDLLQTIVEENHGVRLYPNWANASDFKDTPESFDIVAMHNEDLHDAYNAIELDPTVYKTFPSDIRFLCQRMGVKIPFLPVNGKEPEVLFGKLVRELDGPFDSEKMSLDWMKHVDGVTVHATLPVYLRLYHEKYLHNRRVKDAIESIKNKSELLKELNQNTLAEATDEITNALDIAPDDTIDISNNSEGPASFFAPIQLPGSMQSATRQAMRPVTEGPPIVGGTIIGLLHPEPLLLSCRRGPDKAPAARCRRCNLCLRFGADPYCCRGRGGRRYCERFNEDGSKKN